MFWKLFKFELNYQSRQLSWWFALLMFTAFGYFLSGRQMYHVNVMALTPQNLTYSTTFLCQIALFTTALITASAALRDHQYNFHAFVLTKPVSSTVLTFSRFSSLFVMSFVLIFSGVLAMLLPLMLTDYVTEVYGVFKLKNILWPLLVIVLPNILFTASILYVSASLSKSSIMTFVAAVGIYVFYMMSAALLDSPMFVASTPIARDEINLASLFDPFAVAAFLEQTKLLTAQQLNTHLVVLQGDFLYNRIMWLTVSILLLACVLKTSKYQEGKPKKSIQKLKKKNNQYIPVAARPPLEYKQVAPLFNAWIAFKANVLLDLRITLKGLPFALLLLLVVGLVFAKLINGLNYNFFVGEQLPFTSTMLLLMREPLEIIGIFIVIFFTGELIWRAREQEFDSVLNATPAPNYIYFLAKMTVMAYLISLIISVLIIAAISYQLFNGFYADDIGLFFSIFPLIGLPLLLMAVLSLSIQSLVSNKYVGFVLVATILLFYKSDVASILGVNHYLLRFAETGLRFYSDFSGHDFYTKSIFWFSLYWVLFTALVAFIAYSLSKRSVEESTLAACKRLPTLLDAKGRMTIALISISTAGCAMYILYNTNVLNDYQTGKDIEQLQISYEKHLEQFKHSPSPKITDVDVDVAFYPSQYKVNVEGFFKLINPHNETIKKFLVSIPNKEQYIKIDLNRQHQALMNNKLNVIEIVLNEPLMPNEQFEFRFVTTLEKLGFKNADRNIALLTNGSYFHGSHLLPFIGYNSAHEISNSAIRDRNQLAEREHLPKLIAGKKYHRHSHESDAGWINYQATVSTELGQTPIASGVLQRQWTKDGRNYAGYKVEHEISNFLGFASAAYKTRFLQVGDIRLNAYFHPSHSVNVDQMLATVAKSLKYFEQAYGSYPLPELNLVEIPNRAFARAYPGTIFISEHVGFKEDLSPGAGIDNFSYLLAHEVAHQWWGHQLAAAKTEGEVLLIESLADYSALMVMKDMYGEGYANEIAAKSSNQYLKNRGGDTLGETSLHKMLGQRYLRYHKGPVVLNAIRHLIGEEALNNSLKQLLLSKGNVRSDYATSLDLVDVIKNNSSRSHHPLIDEWLTKMVTYDLSIRDGSVTQLSNGHYQVSADLVGNQMSHEHPEKASKQFFAHQVEIAVYSEIHEPIALAQQQIILEEGEAQWTFTVPTKPVFLVLDPKYMFIDKNRTDNRFRLELTH